VFVEKRGECGVVRVDKVMVNWRRMCDEPRVDNITLDLRETDIIYRFEASERECIQRRRR